MKTIKVTQQHIDKGQKKTTTCPVALALKDEGYDKAHVGSTSICLYDPDKIDYFCEWNLHQWIIAFDLDESVKPFEFYLHSNKKEAEIIKQGV